MKALAKLGFTQSYTYFTWRTHKAELQDYLSEITRYPEREYFRPNFFVNTPDILPVHLQKGEPWMFKSRVALAATLSSNYGIYNGFELLEHEPIPGKRGISQLREIRDQGPRLEQARQHQGLHRPAQPHPAREPGAAADQQSALRAGRRRRGDRLRQGIGRRRQRGRRRDRAQRPRPAHILVPLRRHRDRPAGRRARRCAPIENLVTGERHIDRMGRRAADASIRPTTRPSCSAAKPEASRVVNVLPQIDVAAARSQNDLWYKDAIIYQLHVKAFADSNNDGIGDFAGLTEKLDYLQDLGVTTLWLLPFYPSPGRDDGYDIADYRRINPDFGTMRDFRRFMHEAHRRDLRVITELVINHTSDQHPWFKRARRSRPGTDARNWYVWSDTDQKYAGTRIIFTDTEKSNWTWDPEAKAYLLAPLLLAPARPQLRQSARAVGASSR